jgi:GntR family transcriptional repressor for pyruvate dehydrogenase complex
MARVAYRQLRAPKTAELIAESLRAQIRAGELRTGDRMPTEMELMRQFGVSRPTLREALRMLEHDELIVIRRGARGGATVRPPGVAPLCRALGDLLMQAEGGHWAGEVFEDLDDSDLTWLLPALRRAVAKEARRRGATTAA